MSESQDIQFELDNLFKIMLYIAKYKDNAYAKLPFGNNPSESKTIIANKCRIKVQLLESHVDTFDKLLRNRATAEPTLSRKRIFEKYKNYDENLFHEEVLSILKNGLRSIPTPKDTQKNIKLSSKKVRYFNHYGNEMYRLYFDKACTEDDFTMPKSFLFEDSYADILDKSLDIDPDKKFKSRFDFAKYLNEILQHCNNEILLSTNGIWNWLTCLYFDQLFPKKNKGRQDIRFIVSGNPFYHYRHLVREAWKIYHLYGEESYPIFNIKAVNILPDEFEATTSNNDILNLNFLKLFSELYTKKSGNRVILKQGVTDTDTTKPGILRRLIKVNKRLSINYYLKGMEYKNFRKLILEFDEFNRWLN